MDLGPAIQQSAGPPTSAAPPTAQTTAGTLAAGQPTARLRVPDNWPLLVVLTVQAVLSVRLFGADTAFQDEAVYLWAGHLEWSHWLHGTVMPPFASYFSGAPVIYPPLAALADSVGGLAAARLLSLLFMLGATALLWAVARLLFGRRAAFFAAALFALLGPTLHLGSFATYDAMSLFLVALASWLVVRRRGPARATGRMVAAGVVLALANATAYSSALFDPVVIVLALLTALPGRAAGLPRRARCPAHRPGRPDHRRRCCSAGAATCTGSPDHAGAGAGSRPGDGPRPLLVLDRRHPRPGRRGAVIAWVSRGGAGQTWLLAMLAAAALPVPARAGQPAHPAPR